ncbi:hypothetical protein [Periweissella beninensis]|uniref:hypothetical protein n=1 Tax=Periweissella beninensis TaxID=504936 RepID=UPI0021A3EC74|nr:hypothetical protein [Periweissella beninensis]MCT4396798.1 hypothetical protein [Periweissella beninensis]
MKITTFFKLVTVTTFASVSLLVSESVFADSTTTLNAQQAQNQLDNGIFKGDIVYQDDDITVRSFGDNQDVATAIANANNTVSAGTTTTNSANTSSKFSPYASIKTTTTGNGGVARLNAGDSGRVLYWSVKPATEWPYEFNGSVKIKYYSGASRTVLVGGVGALHSTLSGSVTMNKNHGGHASFTGSAVSLNGNTYHVLPSVGTSF